MTKRREFIKKGMVGTTGLVIGGMGLTARSYASIIGANDRINVGVVGIRGRGQSHISAYCEMRNSHNIRLTTLCDVDEQFFGPRSKMVIENGGEKPKTEWDMHKVLQDPDIDVVSFATPNHWHALGAIWACQAGKHVYVEKPAMHNLWEGRKMIEAARKYDKRMQVGFQNRSIDNVIEAMKFLHDGGIGDVYMARGTCIKPRDSFGIAPNTEPPASLHYDQWLGPAPWRPYNEKRGHYNWHWFWDTGNGDTGNQGPHQFDVARWGLNKKEHPVSIYSTGGIYGIDPDECAQQTPNTQSSIIKYADGTMLEFETRGRYSNGESSLDIRVGNVFYGTEGYLEIDGGTWKAFKGREKQPFAGSKPGGTSNASISLTGSSDTAHFANFIDAVRSGKDLDLNCDIQEGYMSSALALLSNVSYRLDRKLEFMGDLEMVKSDADANAMLTRNYRTPYIVPESV
ncbi:Gfo/Idh/MocA family protein [Membranihabitans marinus]|uniref:Gfo/Idh/MocA family protein n=1 Tax=Membranihabitans marinus TaxID=1227546 RepID=UPI001F43B7E1|nr:Gfo/Idh/MocA family oxidoreductase [Membranihabitans marinus]